MSNRLQASTSPYLQQHAENPVDWYAWGDEALQKARREDRPIFLSIGYAACHWCHVMAHESFEDAATAAQLNADFVCIKVDREERPDLDAIYMEAVVGLTGSGGWPLSVFLTPGRRAVLRGHLLAPDPAARPAGLPRHPSPRSRGMARSPAGGRTGRPSYTEALRGQSEPPSGSLGLEPLLTQASRAPVPRLRLGARRLGRRAEVPAAAGGRFPAHPQPEARRPTRPG